MENINNIPQEIIEKAKRLSSIKGARSTFEQYVEMLMAMEAKKQKKNNSKKDNAKWEQRKKVSEMPPLTGAQLDEMKERNRINQYRAAGLID